MVRLCRSLTHGVSFYSGGVAECILGCHFCYVHAMCWKYLINGQLCVKNMRFHFFFHIFQKLLEKNEPFKRLIMPHRLYVGVLAFQNGVILWVIPLSWCSRAFKSVIGCQLVRCAIYAPKTPDGAPCMLGICMWPGSEKVSHMGYRFTQEE